MQSCTVMMTQWWQKTQYSLFWTFFKMVWGSYVVRNCIWLKTQRKVFCYQTWYCGVDDNESRLVRSFCDWTLLRTIDAEVRKEIGQRVVRRYFHRKSFQRFVTVFFSSACLNQSIKTFIVSFFPLNCNLTVESS